jgi:hypothetical protein
VAVGRSEVRALPPEIVREALRLLGQRDVPSARGAAARELGGALTAPGTVRGLLERAPEGARDAFWRLALDGPATVEQLLGRGWWGHGTLPPPLDWLQRRALVAVGEDGRAHAVDEARAGCLDLTLEARVDDLPDPHAEVDVFPAACVVSVRGPELLERVLAVPGSGLRALTPTVAVSELPAEQVAALLRAVGLASAGRAARLDAVDEAVGPGGVRRLLQRAVAEGRQVRLEYFASSRGGMATERVVDPWAFADDLLRGYCHLRAGERTFALDRVGSARLLGTGIDHHERSSTG